MREWEHLLPIPTQLRLLERQLAIKDYVRQMLHRVLKTKEDCRCRSYVTADDMLGLLEALDEPRMDHVIDKIRGHILNIDNKKHVRCSHHEKTRPFHSNVQDNLERGKLEALRGLSPQSKGLQGLNLE
ncbi:hypothetical protein KVT40_002745 [Elsinoe batatas]|uniref:Uncharacterized protein n=1 Tax=Elsinoe batatas TaxID=2601811 RepID=A0A8K0L4Q8_9PEZI|nr:hypothetical protein KVT40_002745 [Elsinoe batatas]